jgi:hypothetical protein
MVSYCCRGVPPAGRFEKQMELKQNFGVKEKDTMCRGGGEERGEEKVIKHECSLFRSLTDTLRTSV